MRLLSLFAAVLVALAAASDAQSLQLTYSGQTGDLDAEGTHLALVGSTLNLPISGLGNVNQTLVASESVPPNAYLGSASLTTSLGATSLLIDGSSTGSVQGCNPIVDFPCFASASSAVTIEFDLDQSAAIQIVNARHAFTNNGASVVLTHQTLGFVLRVSYFGDIEIPACGSLDDTSCIALASVFGSGAVLPAGQYQVAFDVFAFVPSGSCSIGCNDAGGSYEIIVPEPTTGVLFGIGLFWLFGLAWLRPDPRAGSK
jgi:hypothetical protein